MIYVEMREPNIVVVTRGGAATGANQDTHHDQPQVRPATQNKVEFTVQREKEVFLDARPKFIEKNQASTSAPSLPRRPIREIPEIFNHLFRKKSTGKVSKLKEFF